MTNILNIPTLSFSAEIANNGDWTDSIEILSSTVQELNQATVNAPGSGYTSGTQSLTIVGGAGTAVATVNVLVVGGLVVAVTGITTFGAYTALPQTSACPVAGGGGTGAMLNLTFVAAPLDLTGIAFEMQLRGGTSPANTQVYLNASTTNGQMVNNGTNGILAINVPLSIMQTVPPGVQYDCDIVAIADNHSVNIGGGPVTVTEGITRQST
jgi:hypothetical protein